MWLCEIQKLFFPTPSVWIVFRGRLPLVVFPFVWNLSIPLGFELNRCGFLQQITWSLQKLVGRLFSSRQLQTWTHPPRIIKILSDSKFMLFGEVSPSADAMKFSIRPSKNSRIEITIANNNKTFYNCNSFTSEFCKSLKLVVILKTHVEFLTIVYNNLRICQGSSCTT